MKQGWTISTIGSVAKVFNGNSINAEEKKAKYEGLEEGYPFIATKDVGVNGEVDYDNGVKIPFDTDFKIAMPDAVFVCAEGGSAGKKVAHIDRKVCFGNKLFALQPIKEKVKGGFLYYAVQEAGFKAQFRLSMAGIIGGVSAKKFNSITIPIPPLSEQQRIVALLDAEFAKIDALKANAEKNLQNAKDLFQAALKKELEPKEGWKKYSIGDLFEITDFVSNGSFASLRENVKYYDEPNYAVLVRLVDYSNSFDKNKFVYIDEHGYKFLSKSKLLGGELIMCNIGATIGKTFICPNLNMPMSIGPNVLLIRTNNNCFYNYYLQTSSFKEQLRGIITKTTLEKFNKTQFKQLTIAIPPDIDQQSIVARLDVLNEKCKTLQANYEKTLTLCDDLKQALLRKAFNGEI